MGCVHDRIKPAPAAHGIANGRLLDSDQERLQLAAVRIKVVELARDGDAFCLDTFFAHIG